MVPLLSDRIDRRCNFWDVDRVVQRFADLEVDCSITQITGRGQPISGSCFAAPGSTAACASVPGGA